MRSLSTGEVIRDGNGGGEGMFVGLSLPSTGGEAIWPATEAEWGGQRVGLARTFSSNLPASAPSNLSHHFGRRATWHSVKAGWPQMADGSLDSTLKSFLNSIPADHDLMLTFAHEPENDNPLNQEAARAAEWRAASVHFYDVVKQTRPQTLVGPILMSWTFNSSSGRDWERWILPADKQDFMGLDPYQAYMFPIVGSPTTWHDWVTPQVALWQSVADDLGVPGAIGETACHEFIGNPQRKVDWIMEGYNHAVANNYVAFSYFNVYKPNDTALPMLLNSHAATLAAWSSILINHTRGVY